MINTDLNRTLKKATQFWRKIPERNTTRFCFQSKANQLQSPTFSNLSPRIIEDLHTIPSKAESLGSSIQLNNHMDFRGIPNWVLTEALNPWRTTTLQFLVQNYNTLAKNNQSRILSLPWRPCRLQNPAANIFSQRMLKFRNPSQKSQLRLFLRAKTTAILVWKIRASEAQISTRQTCWVKACKINELLHQTYWFRMGRRKSCLLVLMPK